MKKAPATTTKKGNPTPKPPAGDSSKAPAEPVAKLPVVAQTTVPVHDVQTERRPESVPEHSTEKPTAATDPGEAAFLKELTEKFGSEEEARRVFALFSVMQQEKSTGVTTAAPPPPTVPEETTAQPSIAHSDEPQVSIGAPSRDQSHAEIGPSPNTEERDVEGNGGQEDGGDLAEEVDRMVVDDLGNEDANEGETLAEKSVEGETPVLKSIEGETPGSVAVGETPRNSEGETPFLYVEGGTPFTSVVGETPGLVTEGETPKRSEGETPFVFAEDEQEGKSVGEEIPVITEVQEPEEEGLKEIVDLVDVPEEEDSPINPRESRRRTRRSLLDEVDDLDQPMEPEVLALGAGDVQEEEASGSREEVDEAEERRLAKERKRKGKHAATSQPRKSKRVAFVKEVEAPLPAPTKVPGPGSLAAEDEQEEESEEEEVPNFERTEIWITKKLLGSMAKFDDPKRTQTYKERSAVGKLAKSGKRYDSESLRHIESEKEFLSYIEDIGFE